MVTSQASDFSCIVLEGLDGPVYAMERHWMGCYCSRLNSSVYVKHEDRDGDGLGLNVYLPALIRGGFDRVFLFSRWVWVLVFFGYTCLAPCVCVYYKQNSCGFKCCWVLT